MNTQHTAGQWQLGDNMTTEQISVLSSTGKNIAYLNYAKNRGANDYEQQQANAKLIAAAPDMLEALKYCIDALQGMGYNSEVYQPLVLALAAQEKAEEGTNPATSTKTFLWSD